MAERPRARPGRRVRRQCRIGRTCGILHEGGRRGGLDRRSTGRSPLGVRRVDVIEAGHASLVSVRSARRAARASAGAGPSRAVSPTRFEFAETHMGSEFKIVLYSPDRADRQTRLPGGLRPDRRPRRDPERLPARQRADAALRPRRRPAGRGQRRPVRRPERSQAMYERSRRRVRRDGRPGRSASGGGPAATGSCPTPSAWRRPAPWSARTRCGSTRQARTVQLLKPRDEARPRRDRQGIRRRRGPRRPDAAQAITRALVAGAGDIVVGDPPPGADGWTIGIAPLDDARDAAPAGSSSSKNAAVSTSGDAERFVEIGGKRYSHIVDPRTGLGVVDRSSVTVVAPDGATADGLATRPSTSSAPSRGLGPVEATDGAAALIVRSVAGQDRDVCLPAAQGRLG